MNRDAGLPFWLQPESRRLEFKEGFPSGDQVARTVIAFANGAGGRIVFGIKNKPREIVGIPEIRNRVLAPIFEDLKLIEAWGTGIQKIRRELLKYPEINLSLEETGHAFQIQFRKKKAVPTKGQEPASPATGQVPDKYRTRFGQAQAFGFLQSRKVCKGDDDLFESQAP